jgi:hypothetical protein
MKRRGRADEVLAAARDTEFQRRLASAIKARGGQITSQQVRQLALEMLPVPAGGVAVSFRWDPERQHVDVRVKGASTAVDEQAGGSP